MVNYKQAIRRPFTDLKKSGIAFLLSLVPYLSVLTGIFANGYFLQCGKTAMKKDYKLPVWKEWGDLFVKGLLMIIIGLIYLIPAIIATIVLAGTAAIMIFKGGNPVAVTTAAGAIMLIPLAAIIVTLYVVPMAIMRFVDKGTFKSGFDLNVVLKKAFTTSYLAAFLLVLVYSAIVAIIGGIVSALVEATVVLPFVVLAFVNVIIGITAMTIFGEVYAEIK
jgi:hypothetical protein